MPLHLTQCRTYSIPYHVHYHQQSMNNCWSSQLQSEGIPQIRELITELLTVIIGKPTTYTRNFTDCTIFNGGNCKTLKTSSWLLNTGICEYTIMTLQKQEHYINHLMEPLGNQLATGPIQMGWRTTIEQYPIWQYWSILIPDCQWGKGAVQTRAWTETQNDSPERLQILPTTKGHFQTMCRINTVPNDNVCWLTKSTLYQAVISSPLKQLQDPGTNPVIYIICNAMVKNTYPLTMWLKWQANKMLRQHPNSVPTGSIHFHRLKHSSTGGKLFQIFKITTLTKWH